MLILFTCPKKIAGPPDQTLEPAGSSSSKFHLPPSAAQIERFLNSRPYSFMPTSSYSSLPPGVMLTNLPGNFSAREFGGIHVPLSTERPPSRLTYT